MKDVPSESLFDRANVWLRWLRWLCRIQDSEANLQHRLSDISSNMIPLRRGDLKTWCQSCSVSVWTVHPSSNCSAYARFIGRHGTKRVPKAVLVSAVAPGLLKSDVNPQGVGLDVFDSFRDSMVKDRAQFLIDVPSGPSFGFNRDGATVSQGLIWNWYRQGMTAGFKAAYDCIKAFSETDTSEDIWNADIPILVCSLISAKSALQY